MNQVTVEIQLRTALLSEAEMQRLLVSLMEQRGPAGVTQDEAAALLSWARMTRLHAAMLNLVLKGLARIDLHSDGPAFHHEPNPAPQQPTPGPRYVTGTPGEGEWEDYGLCEVFDTHRNGAFVAAGDTPDEGKALAQLLNDRERFAAALRSIAAGAPDAAALAAVALGTQE